MNKQRWKVLVTVIGVISSVIAWLIYPFTKLGSTWHAIAVAIVMMVVFHLLTKAVLRKCVFRYLRSGSPTPCAHRSLLMIKRWVWSIFFAGLS